jgi:hypothetical protein
MTGEPQFEQTDTLGIESEMLARLFPCRCLECLFFGSCGMVINKILIKDERNRNLLIFNQKSLVKLFNRD